MFSMHTQKQNSVSKVSCSSFFLTHDDYMNAELNIVLPSQTERIQTSFLPQARILLFRLSLLLCLTGAHITGNNIVKEGREKEICDSTNCPRVKQFYFSWNKGITLPLFRANFSEANFLFTAVSFSILGAYRLK